MREVDVYSMLFEQLPVVIRWLLGIVSLGLFAIVGLVWTEHRKELEAMKQELQRERDSMRNDVRDLHNKIDRTRTEMNDSHTRLYNAILHVGGRGQ